MKKFLLLMSLVLWTTCGHAADEAFKQFGGVKVFYSAFNSGFIQPEIASIYKITRGVDKGLVNVAVVVDDQPGGQPAVVKGSVSNIFAQQQTLEFLEVREGDAIYYLAPFNFENEDFLTFSLEVRTPTGAGPYKVSFQRTFYQDK